MTFLKPIVDYIISTLVKSRDHAGKILWIPLIVSTGTFALNVVNALSDGKIDDYEFHKLTQGASSVEIVALVIVMALLKIKR